MKVMQISCADYGSVGKIMQSISEALKSDGNDAVICYAAGAKSSEKEGKFRFAFKYEQGIYRRLSYLSGYPYGFAPLATGTLKKKIKQYKPDVVHLHCPNGNCLNLYKLIAWLKANSYPLVLTNHCEMFYTGNCPHSYECQKWRHGCENCNHLKEYCGPFLKDKTKQSWQKMYCSFKEYKHIGVVSVSDWVHDRSQESDILGSFRNITIENGLDVTPFLSVDKEQIKALREQYKKWDKIILFVTPYFNPENYDNKGSKYLMDIARRFENKNYLFLVVNGDNTMYQTSANNVFVYGRVDGAAELAAFYAMADLSLVLSKRETFSLVCAESLLAGTPVVGFQSGGPESISLAEYSEFCEHGNLDRLEQVIKKWLLYNKSENTELIRSAAKERYSKEKMVRDYLKLYNDLISEVH